MALDLKSMLAKVQKLEETSVVLDKQAETEVSTVVSSSNNISSLSAPLTKLEQVSQKIAELQTAMQKAAPGYESLLFQIHRNIAVDEDLQILLSEEQIGVVVSALAKKKNIVIATAASVGSKTVGGKKLKDISLSEL